MQALIVLSALIAVTFAANGDQSPKVWDALAKLRGKGALTAEAIQDLYPTAVAGTDFPINSVIPQPRALKCSAESGHHGLIADISKPSDCQIYDRCSQNGELTSYICPNLTRFNQITLICDYWYNVDCGQSAQFVDYSNSRLYAGEKSIFLDD
ncbi:hypothetical protein BV898_08165 [Hypsibius exemplaris]|uniref:Chitin-binding type-2 domain-containing protein n=1 Tax=Hypsibius exemplaris TaxID=2072580 RepID=A0A1W0WR74_HYPEX|nr:hypothetical protein BV898_08165 [Hypsibius exemplaris]